MPTKVAIYGGRGVAREVNELIKACDPSGAALTCVAFLVDPDYIETRTIHGIPVHGSTEPLRDAPDISVVIAIGATRPRARIAGEIERQFGERFISLRHPHSWSGTSVTMGVGTFMGPGAIATTDIAIGRHGQLHAGCTIGHDTVMGDFVTVAPGANVSGRVTVGHGVFIGAGAVILPDLSIGGWATIGAGAVVTRDVPEHATVAGVPARILKPPPAD